LGHQFPQFFWDCGKKMKKQRIKAESTVLIAIAGAGNSM
jgi:hypothetical protein